ncbi:hypothetical protein [Methylobacterium oryzihabitans]|uniref:Uncharacterized protein n=1 Tax=Methylobacterium oryzihabitans TaxID=2499852 RepID=A0A3S3UE29_9HYPH|nr:hypothetical protein [Methylobacterium oryzihabitans]RVU21883.1 hypothetical protein EOE48_02220 [Methylobacterium oryzihabitans]
MHRLLAAATLTALLAAPALAGGQPLPPRAGHPPVVRSAAIPVPAPPRAFGYSEPDGVIVEAWLPRNERLPIYNIPPRVFPEW